MNNLIYNKPVRPLKRIGFQISTALPR